MHVKSLEHCPVNNSSTQMLTIILFFIVKYFST